MAPGSPSGQQAYWSNVLLHTSPTGETSSVKPALSCSSLSSLWGEMGLTCGMGRGVEIVKALVLVAAPFLLHKFQGVGREDLQ